MWEIVEVSFRGENHIDAKTGIQDSLLHKWILPNESGIVAVSDGLGSHPFSADGANFLVREGIDTFFEAIFNRGWHLHLPSKQEWDEVALKVAKTITALSVKWAEWNRFKMEEIGATFTLLLFNREGVAVFNVGDGRGVVKANGKWRELFRPFEGETENLTIPFNNNTVWFKEGLFSTNLIKGEVESFIVMTDGAEHFSFNGELPNRPLLEEIVESIRKEVKKGKKHAKIRQEVRRWILKRELVAGDDCSLVIGVRVEGEKKGEKGPTNREEVTDRESLSSGRQVIEVKKEEKEQDERVVEGEVKKAVETIIPKLEEKINSELRRVEEKLIEKVEEEGQKVVSALIEINSKLEKLEEKVESLRKEIEKLKGDEITEKKVPPLPPSSRPQKKRKITRVVLKKIKLWGGK